MSSVILNNISTPTPASTSNINNTNTTSSDMDYRGNKRSFNDYSIPTHTSSSTTSTSNIHPSHSNTSINNTSTSTSTSTSNNNNNNNNNSSHSIPQDIRKASSTSLASSSITASLDIANHPVPDLLLMLSSLLQRITTANDRLRHPHRLLLDQSQNPDTAKRATSLLAFHARNVPSIPIHAYLTRILKYCPAPNEVFLSLLIYFDRMSKKSIFLSNSSNSTTSIDTQSSNPDKPRQVFAIDSFNVHRLVIAGVTCSSKFFSDIFYTNSRYAKVGGLPLQELNHLETQFLILNDFSLMIKLEELQRYADQLLRFWKLETESASSSSQVHIPASLPTPPLSTQHSNHSRSRQNSPRQPSPRDQYREDNASQMDTQ